MEHARQRDVRGEPFSLSAERSDKLPCHGGRRSGVLPGGQIPVGDRELAPGRPGGEVRPLGSEPGLQRERRGVTRAAVRIWYAPVSSSAPKPAGSALPSFMVHFAAPVSAKSTVVTVVLPQPARTASPSGTIQHAGRGTAARPARPQPRDPGPRSRPRGQAARARPSQGRADPGGRGPGPRSRDAPRPHRSGPPPRPGRRPRPPGAALTIAFRPASSSPTWSRPSPLSTRRSRSTPSASNGTTSTPPSPTAAPTSPGSAPPSPETTWSSPRFSTTPR